MRLAGGKWQEIRGGTRADSMYPNLLVVEVLQPLRDLDVCAIGIGDETDLEADLFGHIASGHVDHDAIVRKSLERSVFIGYIEADVVQRAALGPGGRRWTSSWCRTAPGTGFQEINLSHCEHRSGGVAARTVARSEFLDVPGLGGLL